jgi:hypothetical protein
VVEEGVGYEGDGRGEEEEYLGAEEYARQLAQAAARRRHCFARPAA